MKRLAVVFIAALLMSCQPIVEVIERPIADDTDPRTAIVDAASYKWLRKPGVARLMLAGDPIVAHCTAPGWSYIFYDDNAVIGYEPFPEAIDVMHRAVSLTVELHNRDNPGREWAFINVGIPVTPPDTSNDPVLGKWQVALVLDDGTVVEFYAAEFDWEWAMWKGGIMAQRLELYNRDCDPDAHLVWGPDTDPPPEEPVE